MNEQRKKEEHRPVNVVVHARRLEGTMFLVPWFWVVYPVCDDKPSLHMFRPKSLILHNFSVAPDFEQNFWF